MARVVKRRKCLRCKRNFAPEGYYMCTKCKKSIRELSGGVPQITSRYVNEIVRRHVEGH